MTVSVEVSHALPEQKLANQVRALRSERGWSQQDLARLMSHDYGLRWHQTTIAKIEAGQRPIALNEAAALADVFHITGAELLTPASPREEGVTEIAQRERQLMKAVATLDTALAEDIQAQRASMTGARALEREWRRVSASAARLASELARLTKRLDEARARQAKLSAELAATHAMAARAEQRIASTRERRSLVAHELEELRARSRGTADGSATDRATALECRVHVMNAAREWALAEPKWLHPTDLYAAITDDNKHACLVLLDPRSADESPEPVEQAVARVKEISKALELLSDDDRDKLRLVVVMDPSVETNTTVKPSY